MSLCHVQRTAKGFKSRFGDMVRVRAAPLLKVQGQTGVGRDGAKEFCDQFGVKRADFGRCKGEIGDE